MKAIERMQELRLSHSACQSLRNGCPRRFYLNRFFPHPQGQDGWAAMVGKALHAGAQNYLVYRDKERAVFEFLCVFNPAVNKGENEKRTLGAALTALDSLIEYYAEATSLVLAQVNVNGELRPAVEVPFEIRFTLGGKILEIMPGKPVKHVGYIDAIMHDLVSDAPVVDDIKSHRDEQQDFVAKYKFDEQTLPYSLIVELALGRPVNELMVRYVNTYVDLLNPKIQVADFVRTKDDVRNWIKSLMLDVHRIKSFIKMGYWPRNSVSCRTFYGTCRHFDMSCEMENEDYLWEYFSAQEGAKLRDEIDPWFRLDLSIDEFDYAD